MVGKEIIEFVCAGNSGRSPVAELIGRNYLRQRDEFWLTDTASSGTLVDKIWNGTVPSIEDIKRLVQRAVDRKNVLDASQEKDAWKFLESGIYAPETGLYPVVLERFHNEELRFRAEALKEFGIEGKFEGEQFKVKRNYEQTAAKSDRKLVLGMETRHAEFAENLYSGEPNRPVVAVLKEYAMENPSLQMRMSNPFGGTRDEYFSMVRELQLDVRDAIDLYLHNSSQLD